MTTRRGLFSFFAAGMTSLGIGCAKAAPVRQEWRYKFGRLLPEAPANFQELKSAIDLLPRPSFTAQLGGKLSSLFTFQLDGKLKYREIWEQHLSRPDDVAEIERFAAARMSQQIDWFLPPDGNVWWRIPFEWEVKDYAPGWKQISAYVRLARYP
jgi:hypothetical protein